MQTVIAGFHEMAQNSVIPIDWALRVSFTKAFDSSVTFFTLGTSVLDGVDVLSPSEDNPLQEWDKYEYSDYSDRVISIEYERSIDFPYSVQSAIADIALDNHDNYFTPNSASPIEAFILPRRPLRIYAGFKSVSTIPQFVGLSQGMPEISDSDKVVSFHALDFLSEMFSMKLTDTIAMQNVRTDEVLSVIFQQFGLLPTQFSLNKGRNIIPFLFFEKGVNAGNVMRSLMESEMGKLWLDEQGIIRFEERLATPETAVMALDEHNIISVETSGDTEIINTVRIKSNVRAVQSFQPIFTNAREADQEVSSITTAVLVPAGGTAFFPYATLNDPAISADTPTIGRQTDASWFTAVKYDLTEVTSNVTVSLSALNQSSYTMLFSNTNAFDVYIDQVEVWGEPARIIDVIDYEAYDEDSVAKYGTIVLGGDEGISNDFFGSESNCESFALYVIDGYKDFAGVITLEVKGDPSLQLGDVVTVDYDTYNGAYKIIGSRSKLADNKLHTILKARKYTPREWFVLDQSVLDGTEILAP